MTYQARDILHYNGQEYRLNQQLLEGYFEVYPEQRPKPKMVFSSLWRGYLATFEIKDNQLLVKDLGGFPLKSDGGAIAKKLFPNQNRYEWFSGFIRIDDDRGDWDEERPEATFEYLEIYKGDLVQKRTMDFEALQAFKARQFEYFKTTPAYDRAYAFWQKSTPHATAEEIQDQIYELLLRRYTTIPFDSPFLKQP